VKPAVQKTRRGKKPFFPHRLRPEGARAKGGPAPVDKEQGGTARGVQRGEADKDGLSPQPGDKGTEEKTAASGDTEKGPDTRSPRGVTVRQKNFVSAAEKR